MTRVFVQLPVFRDRVSNLCRQAFAHRNDHECSTQFVAALFMRESESQLPFILLSFGNVTAMNIVEFRWSRISIVYCRSTILVNVCSQSAADKVDSPQTAANLFAHLMFCLSSNFSCWRASEGQSRLRAMPFWRGNKLELPGTYRYHSRSRKSTCLHPRQLKRKLRG
jgi:hypothetical protein